MLSSLLLYLAKVILISAVLWGYYAWVLKDERFHQYNRFYLLGAFVLSVLLPLVPFKIWELQTTSNVAQLTQQIVQSSTAVAAETIDWSQFAVFAIILVSFVLLGILGMRIRAVLLLEKRYIKKQIEGIVVVETDLEQAPFSFWNRLFWKNSLDLSTGSGRKIFKHEYTHIAQKHTLDRLFAQCMTAVFWMNPLFWKISQELETLHEFIADRSAVGDEAASELAELLLTTHFNTLLFTPTHSFNVSSIKRRIMMLTTPKNNKNAYLRQLAALPIATVLIALFTVQLQAQAQAPPKAPAPIEAAKTPTPPAPPAPELTWTASETDSLTPNQVYIVKIDDRKGKRKKDGKQTVETVVIRGTQLDTVTLKSRAELDKIRTEEISEVQVRKDEKGSAIYIIKKPGTTDDSKIMVFYPDQNDSTAGNKKEFSVKSIHFEGEISDNDTEHQTVTIESLPNATKTTTYFGKTVVAGYEDNKAPQLDDNMRYFINGKRVEKAIV
ncbi:MAG: hypothetical protein O3C07_04035, partial [Bacteroidetes bacterium]|nr:hypothetical protein [Bacteroidota bacterium]